MARIHRVVKTTGPRLGEEDGAAVDLIEDEGEGVVKGDVEAPVTAIRLCSEGLCI